MLKELLFTLICIGHPPAYGPIEESLQFDQGYVQGLKDEGKLCFAWAIEIDQAKVQSNWEKCQ